MTNARAYVLGRFGVFQALDIKKGLTSKLQHTLDLLCVAHAPPRTPHDALLFSYSELHGPEDVRVISYNVTHTPRNELNLKPSGFEADKIQ